MENALEPQAIVRENENLQMIQIIRKNGTNAGVKRVIIDSIARPLVIRQHTHSPKIDVIEIRTTIGMRIIPMNRSEIAYFPTVFSIEATTELLVRCYEVIQFSRRHTIVGTKSCQNSDSKKDEKRGKKREMRGRKNRLVASPSSLVCLFRCVARKSQSRKRRRGFITPKANTCSEIENMIFSGV